MDPATEATRAAGRDEDSVGRDVVVVLAAAIGGTGSEGGKGGRSVVEAGAAGTGAGAGAPSGGRDGGRRSGLHTQQRPSSSQSSQGSLQKRSENINS